MRATWSLALALSVGIVGACSERFSSSYATHEDASAAGAIDAGWVPPFVPAAAREIREIHDIDTNEVCLRFELPIDERRQLLASMRRLSSQEIEALPLTCRLKPSWWFEGLIEQQPANDAALNAEVYETSQGAWHSPALIAADRTGSFVYVWSR